MKTLCLLLLSLLLCVTASAAVPSSINNDDSCDVKVGPAATLLLPYFEVDPNPNVPGQTTLFTITNVSRYPQIAHVTLWTDWAYPVLTFNLFLTGYDVQAINLYDVIVRGTIAPPSGTSQATTPGTLSSSNKSGNLRATLDCASNPGLLPLPLTWAVRTSLTTGVFNPGGGVTPCSTNGGVHANAIGYVTIDVVANCTNLLPTDPAYYTTDLLFDNVLIGDYQQLGGSPAGTGAPSAFDAAGNPMVHIRAVPEGGGAGSNVATALPYTFYDRYTPAATRTIDRRQPLPSTFAARYIQGGPTAFATNLTIWREGFTGSGESCASHVNNAALTFGEIVRFDEHENPSTFHAPPICQCQPNVSTVPIASSTNTADSIYPQLFGTDVGGWLYLNLNNGGSDHYSITSHPSGAITAGRARTPFGTPRASQNWVTVTMFGDAGGSRMAAELDAAPLGNGCSPAAQISPASDFYGYGMVPVGPAGGIFICPPGTTLTDGTTALCTGTNGNPQP
ncbi:MAG TPA: hypothetical protein VLC46_17100 [Thermoanaerobaculia bacterium]|jgi:hypothetical protein|nr:hypothetical protein [Thermoanaerobaculia bacterium]